VLQGRDRYLRGIVADEPPLKEVYDSLVAFRGDSLLWLQVAELSFESFMIRNAYADMTAHGRRELRCRCNGLDGVPEVEWRRHIGCGRKSIWNVEDRCESRGRS